MDEVERDVVSRKELVEKRRRLLHECENLELQLNVIKAKIRWIWWDIEVCDERAAIWNMKKL